MAGRVVLWGDWPQPATATVKVESFAQYIFSRILRMALYARKYDVSEKINETSTKRTNSYLRENLFAQKCSLRLYARKFNCAKISLFTVPVMSQVTALCTCVK